jgi:hypothetical protein
LYKEGKFKEFGLSNFAAYEVAEIVMICNERKWVRPTVYEGMYNAISKLSFFIFYSKLGSREDCSACPPFLLWLLPRAGTPLLLGVV